MANKKILTLKAVTELVSVRLATNPKSFSFESWNAGIWIPYSVSPLKVSNRALGQTIKAKKGVTSPKKGNHAKKKERSTYDSCSSLGYTQWRRSRAVMTKRLALLLVWLTKPWRIEITNHVGPRIIIFGLIGRPRSRALDKHSYSPRSSKH